MVPNIRFTELLADIEPSTTTTSLCSSAHIAVRNHLWAHPEFNERMQDDFLAGSYSRDTAIRPKKIGDEYKRPDVDVIIVTNYTASDTPDDVLDDVCEALEDDVDGDGGFTVERINKRSVRVVTTNTEIDIVPVFEHGSVYQLPDRDLGHWKTTNPPGHNDWSSTKNNEFNSRFKPLVKLFKWWRSENDTGKRPKGFMLEVLVSLHAPKGESHYGEEFAQMLENINKSYYDMAQLGMKPHIDDPALPGNNIISKVSITDWKNFLERIRVHAGYARRAQNTDDMEEATRLWRRLFGDRFRSTENVAKAQGLAEYAKAPAVAVGFTFPDTAVQAKTPRGFA